MLEALTPHDGQSPQPLYNLRSKAVELDQRPVSDGASEPEKSYF